MTLRDYRHDLFIQIKRDQKVVNEHPDYHAPDLEFYHTRIFSYRQEIDKVDLALKNGLTLKDEL